MNALRSFRPLASRVGGLTSGRPAAQISSRQLSTRFLNSRERQNGGILGMIYEKFWRSHITYVTYIVIGAVTMEYVYGTVTDAVWESVNRGRLYHHIDWSKFKSEDDEEEEEEEEDEE